MRASIKKSHSGQAPKKTEKIRFPTHRNFIGTAGGRGAVPTKKNQLKYELQTSLSVKVFFLLHYTFLFFFNVLNYFDEKFFLTDFLNNI